MIIGELEKLLALRESPVFESLDFSFLTALAPLFLKQTYKPGSLVFDPTSDRPSLYLLRKGKILDDGGRELLSVAGLSDLISLHFGKQVEERSLRAGPEGCVVFVADGRSFIDMIQELPELALHLLAVEEG